MLTDHRCTKYTDCSSCSFYQRDIFKYRLYPKGYVIPQTRCMQNMVFFLVKGEIWLNSEEHPDTTFRGGQFVLQPIGSKVECKVLDYTECIIYLFERPQNICDNRFNKGISIVENERQQPIVMTMVPPIQLFIEGMKLYLNDDLNMSKFEEAEAYISSLKDLEACQDEVIPLYVATIRSVEVEGDTEKHKELTLSPFFLSKDSSLNLSNERKGIANNINGLKKTSIR